MTCIICLEPEATREVEVEGCGTGYAHPECIDYQAEAHEKAPLVVAAVWEAE